jgi:hypothetical protein
MAHRPVDLGSLQTALSSTCRASLRLPDRGAELDDGGARAGSGRIAAASQGAENWHEADAAAPKARSSKTVLLRVAHSPAVIVRAAPHADAEIVTYCRTGTTLLAVARNGLWVRLAEAQFRDTRCAREESVASLCCAAPHAARTLAAACNACLAAPARRSWPEAWLLLAHPTFGRLVDLLSGSLDSLRESSLELPSAEAAAAAEPCNQSTRVFAQLMKVVHAPYVLVRASPSLAAKALGYRSVGALLPCSAQRGDWVRLEPQEAASADPSGAPAAAGEGWVLAVHPELGQLLERVPKAFT